MLLMTGGWRKTSAERRHRNRSRKKGSQGVPSHPRGDCYGKSRGWGRSVGSRNSKETGKGTQVRGPVNGGERARTGRDKSGLHVFKGLSVIPR